MTRRKTRHGATQPEETRERAQLLLRLTPQMIATIRRRAADADKTVSAYVENLVALDAVSRG